MTDGDFRGVDLFGRPIPRAREKAGRPEHEWSQENSNRINLLFATGHEVKDAARAIGISVPTLRKHYFFELDQWKVARLRLTARQLERLNAEADKGNVTAIKELFKRIDKATLAQLATDVADRGRSAPRAQREPKKGKKAQQMEAAGQVRGKFEPPEAPQLIH